MILILNMYNNTLMAEQNNRILTIETFECKINQILPTFNI